MKTLFVLASYIVLILSACSKNKIHHLLPGFWKLQRIEIMKDGQLKKLIKDSSQYWKVHAKDSIEIFSTQHLQNCLWVNIGKTSIRTIDRATGKLADEYLIDRLDDSRLELSTYQKVIDDEYTILYYLERE